MLGDRASDMVAAAAAGVDTRILLAAKSSEAAQAPEGTVKLPHDGFPQAMRLVAEWSGAVRTAPAIDRVAATAVSNGTSVVMA